MTGAAHRPSTHVIATAGHVDHGKSALVRALTGMEPDRFAEERRRGMTIDLGYAWTTLPDGDEVAFVDVPGHQRFIANMLAGLGPAPAVLFVVAAHEGWSRQSAEHLAAADALGVRHGLLVITHGDRADPGPARAEALEHLRASSLGDVEAVVASGVTGTGLEELRSALGHLVRRLPEPDPASPVRFWVDRSFSIRGAGTIVTGTLSAGTVAVGDVLTLSDHAVAVRDLQSLNARRTSVGAVARVALNLRDVDADAVRRGDVLLTPDAFLLTDVVDARLSTSARVRGEITLHVGTAAVGARVRALGGAGLVRVTLSRPLPLRAGDRAVLRDPGRQEVTAGLVVLDADPPPLQRRGAAAGRAIQLAGSTGVPDPVAEVARRGAVLRSRLDRLGVDTRGLLDSAGWLVAPATRATWSSRVPEVVDEWARSHPLDPAVPRAALRLALDVPDALLDGIVAESGFLARDGRVGRASAAPTLGVAEAGLRTVLDRLEADPFAAPDRDTLTELGLGPRELAAAVRMQRLLRVADGIVLRPDAPQRAAALLASLPQPFTLSEARQALGTTRRVAVPLLEYLDKQMITERMSSTTRRVRRNGE